MTTFSFEGLAAAVNGTIDEDNKTITLTVLYGTDVTALVPTFTTTGDLLVTITPSASTGGGSTIPTIDNPLISTNGELTLPVGVSNTIDYTK